MPRSFRNPPAIAALLFWFRVNFAPTAAHIFRREFKQLCVRPALDDSAAFQDENLVRMQDGRKPMRDDEACPMRHQMFQRFLDQTLGRGIHARCRFIQNQNRRIFQ